MRRFACIFALLLLLLSVSAHKLIHLPLSRRPVPASRAFSHVHRPWTSQLVSKSNFPYKLNHAHLSFPVRTDDDTATNLPEEPMYGDIVTLGEYYLALKFGGQIIHVQIDTGSSTIAVPLKQCTNCRPDDRRLDLDKAVGTAGFIACDSDACARNSCNAYSACTVCSKSRRACCSAVAPEACGFFLQYADRSGVSGALVQADVTIAGMTVPLVFGAILRETKDFENTNVDGILGMAYKSLACNPTCVTPLFDTLVQAGKIERDVFSTCTARHGGTLTLGGSNPHFYEGELQYVPLIHRNTPHFYDIAVKSVTVGGSPVHVPDFADGIVDSGTTVLVLAPTSYSALKAHFQSNYCQVPGLCPQQTGRQVETTDIIKGPAELISGGNATLSSSERLMRKGADSWFSPGYCATLTKDHVKMLPDITIGLANGVNLVLDPDTYMLTYEKKSAFGLETVVYRCLGITFLEGLQHMENNAIIGNTVLQKYFVEYDRENSRIGFAIGKNCLDTPTRMSGPAGLLTGSVASSLPRWIVDGLIFGSIIAAVIIIAACAMARKYGGYVPIPGSNSQTGAAS